MTSTNLFEKSILPNKININGKTIVSLKELFKNIQKLLKDYPKFKNKHQINKFVLNIVNK